VAISPRAFGRGVLRRCPRCGHGDLFTSFFRLRPSCPGCGFGFEREEGYWLGAMIVIMALTEFLFGVWFVGGMLVTWPDVPWTLLLVGGVVLNLVVPIAGYPWSKTTWMGLHLTFVPLDAAEEATAVAVLAAQDGDRAGAADGGTDGAAQDGGAQDGGAGGSSGAAR
jgi:uncharacterized protein (DUF983 family)